MPSSQLAPPERPAPSGPTPGPLAGDAPPDSVLDRAALARLAELDPRGELHLLDRVMTTFQSSASRLLTQLDAARASGDREAIRLVAHTLKSSSGYIGALDLARRCAALEVASHAGPHVDLAPEIAAMTTALDVALAAVSRRLGA